MGCELVSDSFSQEKGGGDDVAAPTITCTERFNKVFPYYLAIGMTYDEFWNQDCLLAKYFREADKIKTERKNAEMWLQGRYYYEAILAASPILHAFAKKGTRPHPYLEAPYPMNREEAKSKQESEEEVKYNAMRAKMIALTQKTRKGG